MLAETHTITSGVKAALLAVGVTASAMSAHISHQPMVVPIKAHTHAVYVLPAKKTPAVHGQEATLRQIDHRLGVIERVQKTLLRGYETGGIYR